MCVCVCGGGGGGEELFTFACLQNTNQANTPHIHVEHNFVKIT